MFWERRCEKMWREWKWTAKKPFDVLRKKMWTLTDSRKCKWTEKGEPFMFCKFEKVDINIDKFEKVFTSEKTKLLMFCKFEKVDINIDKLEKLFVNKWIDEPFDVLQTCRAQSPLLQQFQVLHWGQISIQTFFVKSFTSSEKERKWFHWYIILLVFILISTIPLKIFHPLSWKC